MIHFVMPNHQLLLLKKVCRNPQSLFNSYNQKEAKDCISVLFQKNRITFSGSPIKQEDPPNLSILLSGGKETNKDSLSKGD